MANWLRLRRQSHAPREQDGTETIYAAADGTLMHMDPEGNVANLAGAGSLPSPTSEGDVLTVVDGDWAGEAPSGGSQPGAVRLLDLGMVDLAALAVDSVVLYTPDEGEIVGPILWREVDCDFNESGSVAVYIGGATANTILGGLDNDKVDDGAYFAANPPDFVNPEYQDPQVASPQYIQTINEPLLAAFTAGLGGYGPASAWAALTEYPIGASVLGDDGHLWKTETGGTSGATIPDFAGNEGDSVVDGDVTWDDVDVLPENHQARVLVYVSTPDTP